MEIKAYGNGSSEAVVALEKKFMVRLPDDYRDFLVQSNGGGVSDGFMYVNKLDEHLRMAYFFGIGIDIGFTNLYKINEEYGADIPEKSLLIGVDEGNGFILLVNDGENNGIWYYDDSYFFEQSTDDLNTYFICETFSEFIEMLETTRPA